MRFMKWTIVFPLLVSFFSPVLSQAWSACYDEGGETACYYWHVSGMCQQLGYRNYMYQICRRTCNLCPSIYIRPYSVPTTRAPYQGCRDARTRCPSWKNFCYEGNQYYEFMQKHCPRTCSVCADPTCKDLNKKCNQYKVNNYCDADHKYFGYMRRNCPKSCKFCVSNKSEVVTAPPRPTVPVYINKEFDCDFETNECNWINQFFEDNGDWIVGTDKNGPESGYNNSLQYLYVDNKHQGYKTKLLLPWQLVLPDGQSTKGVMCFHFMYQISHGRLTVLETENPSMARKQPHPTKLFENVKYKDQWTKAKMNIRADSNYNLQLIAQKGVSNSYIIVDDLYFTDGKCA